LSVDGFAIVLGVNRDRLTNQELVRVRRWVAQHARVLRRSARHHERAVLAVPTSGKHGNRDREASERGGHGAVAFATR
jgi:hypothetical protein